MNSCSRVVVIALVGIAACSPTNTADSGTLQADGASDSAAFGPVGGTFVVNGAAVTCAHVAYTTRTDSGYAGALLEDFTFTQCTMGAFSSIESIKFTRALGNPHRDCLASHGDIPTNGGIDQIEIIYAAGGHNPCDGINRDSANAATSCSYAEARSGDLIAIHFTSPTTMLESVCTPAGFTIEGGFTASRAITQ